MEQITISLQPDDIPEPVVPSTVAAPDAAEPAVDLSNPQDAFSVLASEALRDFQQQLLARPALSEEARIVAQSPQGFTVMLITRKAEPAQMIEAVGKMQGWLIANGYKPAEIPF